MSTAATEVRREASRPLNKGTRPAHALDRSTVRTIEEAIESGCGLNLQRRMTAEAAYYRAEQRGFQPGHELEDWLVAECEIQRLWTRAREEGPLPCHD
jgi:Protein of unknown function (DUF2934)